MWRQINEEQSSKCDWQCMLCVCVRVCVRETEREREYLHLWSPQVCLTGSRSDLEVGAVQVHLALALGERENMRIIINIE